MTLLNKKYYNMIFITNIANDFIGFNYGSCYSRLTSTSETLNFQIYPTKSSKISLNKQLFFIIRLIKLID